MTSPASTTGPDLRGAGLQRSLVALIQVLGLAVWFSATAIAPTLRGEWGLGDTSVVWLTGAVQIGFVVGALTSSVLNLPDRMPPQRLVALCAFGAAGSTALLAAVEHGGETTPRIPAPGRRWRSGRSRRAPGRRHRAR